MKEIFLREIFFFLRYAFVQEKKLSFRKRNDIYVRKRNDTYVRKRNDVLETEIICTKKIE